jgi:integrase
MLSEMVANFVSLRRIGGFKFDSPEVLLRSFAQFASLRGDSHVRIETAIAWAAQTASPEARETRLRTVIAFARHCRAEDPAHEIPPKGVFGTGRHPRRPVAYIFTPNEIQHILSAALELQPQASLRPYTYHTVFGLLASTGLRIGEALRLRFADITQDGLLIRETKFKKSRLVPVHATVARALQRYRVLRDLIGGRGDHLFVGQKGQPLRRSMVQQTFCQILVELGLSTARGGHSPRLHDLRHTWAVRALEACPEQTDLVGRHMRAVTTYLGHVSVATGYWYLHTSPVLMKKIADACAALENGGEP